MLEKTINELILFLEKHHFKGWEPYDIPGLKITPVTRPVRVLLTQLIRLSPISLHPFFKNKTEHAKAAALFARSFLLLFEITREQKYQKKAVYFLEWLETHRCSTTKNFSIGTQYQLNMKNYSANPNTPAPLLTCFSVEAFLSAYEIFKDNKYLELAESGINYFLEELPQVKVSSDRSYFIYHPNNNQFIPNSPAVICGTLARFYFISKNQELLTIIKNNLNYIANYQQEDGSWFYHPGSRYIDSFHTAFVLEALAKYQRYTGDESYKKQLLKGLAYYEKNFFESDMKPIHKKRFGVPTNVDSLLTKIDLRDIAMGLVLFNEINKLRGYPIRRILNLQNWSINHFKSNKGYFYYQKVPLYTIKGPFLSMQAWMLYGLCVMLKSLNSA
ncbi:MAG: AGE family epimerase/isomerase [Gammaproteobacteria bacterium]|nr:AGE family epimerase/isomerase [Gammaproteobacteria bacterium]